ncbi:MAG: transketolase family protein, partial [Acidobacteria bacterium]|nr:transketolase family protein [Acidobacteriota bacterium]
KRTRQGYVDGLIELARENPRVVVLDSDVAKATQTCDFQKVFPDRFFNCGVQEGNMMSVAAGLALEGFIPFASTFGVFASCRAGDQVRNSIAYPKVNVKIGATHCGISTGGDGASHQTNEDIAIMRSFPNMTILVPGDYQEAKLATKAAAEFKGPVYLRFGRDVYPIVPEIHDGFHIGRSKLLREGSDLTIITTGIMVSEGLRAADLLRARGILAGVLHMPTVKPLDGDAVVKVARRTRRIVTIEEHSVIGGLGEAVAALLADRLPTPVRRVGVKDVFGESGHANELLDRYGLRAQNIVQEAMRLLNDQGDGDRSRLADLNTSMPTSASEREAD